VSGLKSEALAACETALRDTDFKRARRGNNIFMRDAAPGVRAWVGLNTVSAGLPTVFSINPVVGVRHEELEGLREELCGNGKPDINPTLARPLGYLLPEGQYREWEFVPGGDHAAVAEKFCGLIEEYGSVFISRLTDWAELSRELEYGTLVVDHVRPTVAPLAKVMNGDGVGALAVIDAELGRIAGQEDFYTRAYRPFRG